MAVPAIVTRTINGHAGFRDFHCASLTPRKRAILGGFRQPFRPPLWTSIHNSVCDDVLTLSRTAAAGGKVHRCFVDKYPQIHQALPVEARPLSPLPRQTTQAEFVDKYPHGDRMRARGPPGQREAVRILLVLREGERAQQEAVAVSGAGGRRSYEEAGRGVADCPLPFGEEGGRQEARRDADEGLSPLRRQLTLVDKYPQLDPAAAAPRIVIGNPRIKPETDTGVRR